MSLQGGGQTSLRAEAPQEAKIAVTGVVSDADGPIIRGTMVGINPNDVELMDILKGRRFLCII
ncbi:hypothetical protein AGMMS49982_22810 [Bacteroidia bacterium]|nr:hypothetical protein AGMMS49982_22810 [Bacteroidia bacterium]